GFARMVNFQRKGAENAKPEGKLSTETWEGEELGL
ncbi:MAG: hypothetical protein JWM16_1755, partial [Verrucomicrobiales bacterium]|nr:hypothetical protein [Verrucomicrobiales bacterium]